MKIMKIDGKTVVGMGSATTTDFDPDRDDILGQRYIKHHRKRNKLYSSIGDPSSDVSNNYEKLMNEIKALKEENEKLNTLLENEKSEKEAAIDIINSKDEEINNLTSDNAKLQNSLENDITKLKEKDEEIEKLKKEIKKLKDRINDMQNNFDSENKKNADLINKKDEEIEELKAEIERLNGLLNKKQKPKQNSNNNSNSNVSTYSYTTTTNTDDDQFSSGSDDEYPTVYRIAQVRYLNDRDKNAQNEIDQLLEDASKINNESQCPETSVPKTHKESKAPPRKMPKITSSQKPKSTTKTSISTSSSTLPKLKKSKK